MTENFSLYFVLSFLVLLFFFLCGSCSFGVNIFRIFSINVKHVYLVVEIRKGKKNQKKNRSCTMGCESSSWPSHMVLFMLVYDCFLMLRFLSVILISTIGSAVSL